MVLYIHIYVYVQGIQGYMCSVYTVQGIQGYICTRYTRVYVLGIQGLVYVYYVYTGFMF